MKIAPLLAGAILAVGAFAANAAELILFGEQLNAVDRLHLVAAAKAAGGKLTRSTASSDVFNASAIGLPGAQTLELVYLNGQVVMAQYTLEQFSSTDERLRKMLVSKYGFPQSVDNTSFGTSPAKFDQQYVGDGKYRWPFDSDMELVFSKEFSGGRYLTYVNKPLQAQLQHKLESADKQSASQAAKAKHDVF